MNILITGASRGIGAELAEVFLEHQNHIFACARNFEFAPALRKLKEQYPEYLTLVQVDVTREEDLTKLQSALKNQSLDVLINNAGVFLDGETSAQDIKQETLEKSFAVNSIAPVMVTTALLKNLKKSPNAKLICITSRMGSISDNTSGACYAYRMSKAALNMFVKSFAVDHKDIVALTLHPGWVKTEMGGPNAPTLPRESAQGLYKVITTATLRESGCFLDYKGQAIEW